MIAVDNRDDPLMAEELFGPLPPVLELNDVQTTLRTSAGAPNPGALYVRRKQEEQTLPGDHQPVGHFNDVIMQAGVPELPFGGWGQRHGRYNSGFDTFSHDSRAGRPFRRPLRYPPTASISMCCVVGRLKAWRSAPGTVWFAHLLERCMFRIGLAAIALTICCPCRCGGHDHRDRAKP